MRSRTQRARRSPRACSLACWPWRSPPSRSCPPPRSRRRRSAPSRSSRRPTAGSQNSAIAVGPDGNLWYARFLANTLVRVTPAGTATEFTVPTPGARCRPASRPGRTGTCGSPSAVRTRSGASRPRGTITEFPLPTPRSVPRWITAGPDGNLWFTEYAGNTIGRITPRGTSHRVPDPDAGAIAVRDRRRRRTATSGSRSSTPIRSGASRPAAIVTEFALPTAGRGRRGITAGPDGNLWFTESAANQIGRITPAGRRSPSSRSRRATPAGRSRPGSDGNLWFTAPAAPTASAASRPPAAVTEFPVPSGSTGAIGAGPDGNLWVAQLTAASSPASSPAGRSRP